MTASVPISETGTEMLGMIVAGTLRRKTKITSTTSTMASTSSKAASSTEERITPVLSATMSTCIDGGRLASSCGSCRLDLVDRLDDVGARLALHVEHDGRRAVEPGALLDVLSGLADRGHVAQHDRRAVLVGDDRVEIVLRVRNLIVVVDGVVELGTVEIALRLAQR